VGRAAELKGLASEDQTMQETANGFRVEIPPMRRVSAITFAILFLAFSIVWEYFYSEGAGKSKALIGLAVTLFSAMGGMWVLFNELFGIGLIELDGFDLKVSDTVFGYKRIQHFDITLMQNVRVGASSYWQGNTYVMSEGRIQFEYNSKMISIGGNVDEGEAFRIVDGIRR
jgi:hypothetical protein